MKLIAYQKGDRRIIARSSTTKRCHSPTSMNFLGRPRSRV